MPADLMIGHHLSISAFWNAARPAGVCCSADATSTAVGLLTRVAGLGDVDVEGRSVRARAENGARAVPTIIAALDDAGVSTASVTVARPSLDDVYLRHVGRSFVATEVAA